MKKVLLVFAIALTAVFLALSQTNGSHAKKSQLGQFDFRTGVVAPLSGLWLARVNSLPSRSTVLRSNSRISPANVDPSKNRIVTTRGTVRISKFYSNLAAIAILFCGERS
jgi:hypothetical protein